MIQSADAIYVTGGNSDLMMKTWRQQNVDNLLQQAYQSGTVMSGLSAGASCWFKYICSNSYYTGQPFVVEAMGWLKAFICPHYDSEPFRQDALKKMLKASPGMVGLVLDEYAAIEIVDNQFRVHSYGSGGLVRKCFWRDGRYVIEAVAARSEPKSLDDLIRITRLQNLVCTIWYCIWLGIVV